MQDKKPENQSKTMSRTHKRRPSYLLRDYIRRQQKHRWLETHIWHAKRFFMKPKFGYQLV